MAAVGVKKKNTHQKWPHYIVDLFSCWLKRGLLAQESDLGIMAGQQTKTEEEILPQTQVTKFLNMSQVNTAAALLLTNT